MENPGDKENKSAYPPTILGHIDTLMTFRHQRRNFSTESDKGVCDYPRMWRNNIKFALFAIYPAMSQYNIISGLDNWLEFVSKPENRLTHIKNIEDFEKVGKTDNIGAILHTEGAGGFDSEFMLLRLAARLGMRTMGITWANPNQFGTGYLFRGAQIDKGLTTEGRGLIHEAQRLGITVDVSHLNDLSFSDAMEITEKPVMASHSNARSISNMGRNLTDEQIQKMHANHGVIGLNFGAMFLDPAIDATNLSKYDSDLSFDVFKSHIDQIVIQADVATVAFGTDFDGTTLPTCLDSCDKLTQFYDFLMEHGYSRQDLQKMTYDNFYRVFRATWT
ncbi:MAG: dipeptidase [Promethearchaeota archaeon]